MFHGHTRNNPAALVSAFMLLFTGLAHAGEPTACVWSLDEVARIEADGDTWDVKVHGDHLFVSHGTQQLQIYDITDPAAPSLVGVRAFDAELDYMTFHEGLGYMLTPGEEIPVVDLSDPTHLPEVGSIARPEWASSAGAFVIRGNLAFTLARWHKMQIYDISSVESAQLVGEFEDEYLLGLDVQGAYAYLTTEFEEFIVVDISNPALPQEVGRYAFEAVPSGLLPDVDVAGSIAYAMNSVRDQLIVVDVSNPANPQPLQTLSGLGGWHCLVQDDKLFIAGSNGVSVLDISDATAPALIAEFETPEDMHGSITFVEPYVYVSYLAGGVYILELKCEPCRKQPERKVMLQQNHPNPFNPSTTISFTQPVEGHVELSIYNARGQLVRTLANDVFPAGEHRFLWNGTDLRGNRVNSGVYFCKLVSGDVVQTRKMVVVK